jgi:hypothetical protein
LFRHAGETKEELGLSLARHFQFLCIVFSPRQGEKTIHNAAAGYMLSL